PRIDTDLHGSKGNYFGKRFLIQLCCSGQTLRYAPRKLKKFVKLRVNPWLTVLLCCAAPAGLATRADEIALVWNVGESRGRRSPLSCTSHAGGNACARRCDRRESRGGQRDRRPSGCSDCQSRLCPVPACRES